MEGKRLDELQKQQEIGKRPYQTFLKAFVSGLVGLIISIILSWIFY